MGKAIKKPIEVEFELWDGTDEAWERIEEMCGNEIWKNSKGDILLDELYGIKFVEKGDYIIKRIDGEIRLVKGYIFNKTYDII